MLGGNNDDAADKAKAGFPGLTPGRVGKPTEIDDAIALITSPGARILRAGPPWSTVAPSRFSSSDSAK
jgi:hypothetical protein